MSEIISRQGDDSAAVETGARVTLHFSLLFPNGQEIDTTRNGKPATFEVGDGNLLPGFEAVLMGQRAGFSEQIELPAEQAFGERNEGNVQVIDRARFERMFSESESELEPGLVVSFQAPDGELPGVVVAVYEGSVKVDFNHPLSGSPIVFDVSILKVEAPAA